MLRICSQAGLQDQERHQQHVLRKRRQGNIQNNANSVQCTVHCTGICTVVLIINILPLQYIPISSTTDILYCKGKILVGIHFYIILYTIKWHIFVKNNQKYSLFIEGYQIPGVLQLIYMLFASLLRDFIILTLLFSEI